MYVLLSIVTWYGYLYHCFWYSRIGLIWNMSSYVYADQLLCSCWHHEPQFLNLPYGILISYHSNLQWYLSLTKMCFEVTHPRDLRVCVMFEVSPLYTSFSLFRYPVLFGFSQDYCRNKTYSFSFQWRNFLIFYSFILRANFYGLYILADYFEWKSCDFNLAQFIACMDLVSAVWLRNVKWGLC